MELELEKEDSHSVNGGVVGSDDDDIGSVGLVAVDVAAVGRDVVVAEAVEEVVDARMGVAVVDEDGRVVEAVVEVVAVDGEDEGDGVKVEALVEDMEKERSPVSNYKGHPGTSDLQTIHPTSYPIIPPNEL
jgi:hypothetical protein